MCGTNEISQFDVGFGNYVNADSQHGKIELELRIPIAQISTEDRRHHLKWRRGTKGLHGGHAEMSRDTRRSSYGRSPLEPNPGDLRPAVGHLVSNPSFSKPRRSDDGLAEPGIIR
jgi:hypothetical protein